MVERGTLNAEVAGSSPASPANDAECERILNAVVDYNMDQVYKKMELHCVDFDLALEMQMAVILAEARAK